MAACYETYEHRPITRLWESFIPRDRSKLSNGSHIGVVLVTCWLGLHVRLGNQHESEVFVARFNGTPWISILPCCRYPLLLGLGRSKI
jgi:hypothetical protein